MTIAYDPSVDAAYISLSETQKSVGSESFSIDDLIPFGDINIDFDDNRHIVGFEILNASKYLAQDLLKGAI